VALWDAEAFRWRRQKAEGNADEAADLIVARVKAVVRRPRCTICDFYTF
jgi:hypothetical protein